MSDILKMASLESRIERLENAGNKSNFSAGLVALMAQWDDRTRKMETMLENCHDEKEQKRLLLDICRMQFMSMEVQNLIIAESN